MLVLAVLAAGCGIESRADARMAGLGPGRLCPAADATRVVQLVNDARGRAGLRALQSDAHLARIAGERSAAMARQRRLSHDGWERTLRTAGLRDDHIGENVAYNYEDADAVMVGWMQSPGHRANILRRGYARIGVGCVIDGRGHRWWTQDFAG